MKPSEILREIKKLPNKLLGQNFLADDSVVRDILEAAQVKKEEVVVEIGPGLGAMTFQLAQQAKKVLAIEADQELATYLRLKKKKNVKIIHADALKVDWTLDVDGPYKIVANIPYSITSPLLRQTFNLQHRPTKIVLLVQKEVAERILAKPDSSDRGFLTLLTEANAVGRIVRRVKAGSFYPKPKVESAIIELIPLEKPLVEEIFWPAIEAGFRHKRQTLANAINKDLHVNKADITKLLESIKLNPLIRAQNLSLDNWMTLSKELEPLVTISR